MYNLTLFKVFPVWLLTWHREAFEGHGTKSGWQRTHPVGIDVADSCRSGPHLCSIRSRLPGPDARPVTKSRKTSDHDPFSSWKVPVCLFSTNQSSNERHHRCATGAQVGPQLRSVDKAKEKEELTTAVSLLWSIPTCYTLLSRPFLLLLDLTCSAGNLEPFPRKSGHFF